MRQMLIDGKLVNGSRSYPSINPATGEVIEEAPDATVEDAEAAIRAARRAFDRSTWSTDVEFRMHCLNQLHAAMTEHVEDFRALTVTDVGAPIGLTYGPQLETPMGLLKFYADLLKTYPMTEDLGDIVVGNAKSHRWVEKEAAGVVAAIIAYNYPTQLALAKLAPALAAGCTVVLKAAPDTPLLTLLLGELIANETDIPPGVVNVIASSEVAVAEVLTSSPDVDMITFTGSTPVGRRIMEVASRTVKRVFLELGGKSALIMLDDADPAMIARVAAFTICSHSGQGCAITSRLLVPRAQHDEVVGLVKQALAAVKVGDPADPQNYMGPLISAKQRDKVDGVVQRAIEAGAKVELGGHKLEGPGFFYAPTLLTGVDQNSEVAQDELFGPVLVVLPYDTDDDAVEIANNSIFGLSGGVWSADQNRAVAVARRIRTGTVGINGGSFYGVDSPFGGYKQAGIGRESGVAGLEEFLERKTLATPVG